MGAPARQALEKQPPQKTTSVAKPLAMSPWHGGKTSGCQQRLDFSGWQTAFFWFCQRLGPRVRRSGQKTGRPAWPHQELRECASAYASSHILAVVSWPRADASKPLCRATRWRARGRLMLWPTTPRAPAPRQMECVGHVIGAMPAPASPTSWRKPLARPCRCRGSTTAAAGKYLRALPTKQPLAQASTAQWPAISGAARPSGRGPRPTCPRRALRTSYRSSSKHASSVRAPAAACARPNKLSLRDLICLFAL